MNVMLGNWRTTIFGIIAAFFTYFAQLGPNLPTTKGQWLQALASAAMVALGFAAKDAAVGSKPPGA